MFCPMKFCTNNWDDYPNGPKCETQNCAWWVEQGTRSDGTLAGCCAVLGLHGVLQTIEEKQP